MTATRLFLRTFLRNFFVRKIIKLLYFLSLKRGFEEESSREFLEIFRAFFVGNKQRKVGCEVESTENELGKNENDETREETCFLS